MTMLIWQLAVKPDILARTDDVRERRVKRFESGTRRGQDHSPSYMASIGGLFRSFGLQGRCPLLAQNGHDKYAGECLLLKEVRA